MSNLYFKRILMVCMGLIIRGIGVGFIMLAHMGSNPATLFQEGFTKMLHLSYGNGAALANLIILIAVWIYNRKYIHIASVLAIFLIGYSANFITAFIPNIQEYQTVMRMIYLVSGSFILAMGTKIYLLAQMGVGALDVLAEIIYDHTNLSEVSARYLCDGSFLVLGVLMGGQFGLGTIISLILMGPCMNLITKTSFFNKYLTVS